MSPALLKYVVILGGFLALLAGVWFYSGYVHEAPLKLKVQAAEKARDAERVARAEEGRLQEKMNEILVAQAAANRSIDAKFQRAADRLLQRPDRASPETRAACPGATGAELSRPDGLFLSRYATRADRVRSALQACYAAEDALAGGRSDPNASEPSLAP